MPHSRPRALAGTRGEQRQLRLEQSSGPGNRRQSGIEVAGTDMEKIGNSAFDFPYARAARPAGGEMLARSSGAPVRKLAVDRQKELLIGKMRIFMRHGFRVRPRGSG